MPTNTFAKVENCDCGHKYGDVCVYRTAVCETCGDDMQFVDGAENRFCFTCKELESNRRLRKHHER